MTKRPVDWKAFLTNNEDKLQLTKLIMRVWSDDEVADKYNNKRVIILSEGYAYGIEGRIWDLIVSVPDHCLSFHFAVLRSGFLVVLRLNVPVNNFSVMSGRSHRFLGRYPVLSGSKVSCSRTHHGGGRSRTPDLSLRSPTLYH